MRDPIETTDPELAAFRDEARTWLEEHAPKHVVPDPAQAHHIFGPEDVDRAKAWQRCKAEAGWAGLHWPTEYGGRGLEPRHAILFAEEEKRFAVPTGVFFAIGMSFVAPTVLAHGTSEQKLRFLPPLLRGDEVWVQLFSEPGAGSDLAGISARALRDGDEWAVSGQKVWNTYAQYGDFAILVARHDPDLPKHKGLTYFLLDMRQEGVQPRPLRQIAGRSHFCEVFLDGARIPDSQRLGEVGEGWQVAMTTLMNERLSAGGGASLRPFERLFQLAGGVSHQSGRALDDPHVRSRLADWYVEGQGLEVIHRRTLERLAEGRPAGPESSLQKLVMGRQQQEIASFAMDLLDAAGSRVETGSSAAAALQEMFLECPGVRIAGGTDEILRNILAERVLGLPGDIRVDRDKPYRDVPGN